MNVAVVAETMEHAVSVTGRLGMVLSARCFAAGFSPLLGHKFTAVLLVDLDADPESEWWDELRSRNDGPTWRLDTT